ATSAGLIQMAKVGAVTVLMLMLPFAIISSIILARYYGLYVSALVYAADLHKAEGLTGHHWLDEIERYRAKFGSEAVDNGLIMRRRTSSWPLSWSLYALRIVTIAVAGFIFGVALIATM